MAELDPMNPPQELDPAAAIAAPPEPATPPEQPKEEENFFSSFLTGDEKPYEAKGWLDRANDTALANWYKGTLVGAGSAVLQSNEAEALAKYKRTVPVENPVSVTAAQIALIKNDLYPKADSFSSWTADITGGLSSGFGSPEGWIAPGISKLGVIAGKALLPIVGKAAAPVLGRMAASGVSQAAIQTATDPAVQALSIGAKTQAGFEPGRLAMAPVTGFVGGAALHGAGEGIGAISRKIGEAFEQRVAENTFARLSETDPAFRSPTAPPPGPEPVAAVDPGIAAMDAPPAAVPHEAARAIAETSLDSIPPISAAPNAPMPAVKDGPAGIFMFDPASLQTDAKRFQYKDNGDAEGVTTALKGVTKWDQAKANQVIVWESKGGERFVADGHQRSGLARRLVESGNESDLKIPGILYRERDGISAEDVRSIAAAKNIAEGSGSPIDGAKILRTRPDLMDGSMPISRTEARQSFELARLDDEAFRMVTNEVVPYQQAAVVGRLIPNDGPRQIAAMKALARFEPKNETEASVLVQRVSQSELGKAGAGAQTSMFGDLESADSSAGDEMRIVAKVIAELKKDKALFSRVVINAGRLEEAGSKIERGAAQAVKQDSEIFARRLASEAYSSGAIRTDLIAAAKDLKNGKASIGEAASRILASVRRSAESDVLAGGRSGGGAEFRTEPGAEGKPQTLIPGVEPVTDRARAELAGSKPLTGGNAAPPAGGLFDEAARNQPELAFRKRSAAGGEPSGPGPISAAGEAPNAPEVTSLQQQAFALSETIGIPLRQGRVQGKEAIGQYNSKYGVARVQQVADFYTVAHEGGHAIEQKFGQDLTAAIDAARPELGPLDYEPGKARPSEGFAEWFATLLTNPARAKNAAPGFFDEFRRFLSARDPELLRGLDEAAASYARYLNAPSGEKIAAQVVPLNERGRWFTEVTAPMREEGFFHGLPATIGNVLADAYSVMWDSQAPMARAVRDLARLMRDNNGGGLIDIKAADNPEVLLRLWGRAQQGALHQMRYGVIPYHQVESVGPSLHQAIATATGQPNILGMWKGKAVDDFSSYLVAKRASVLWDRYHGGKLDNPPVGFSKGDADQAMADLLAANPSFEEGARMVHAFTRNMLEKQRDAGLITQDLFETLSGDPFYVPLFREVSDKPLSGKAGGGAGQDGPGMTDTIKRLRGSSRDIIDPLQGIMMQTFLAERTIRHNDIVKALADLAGKAGPGAGRIVEPVPAKELMGTPFELGDNIKAVARQRGLDPGDTELLMQSVTNAFGDDPIMGTMFRMQPASKKGEPILFYKEAGELRAARLSAGKEGLELYETLTALPDTMKDLWAAVVGGPATVLRAGITTNPVFVLTNYVRDQMAVGILRKDYIPFFSGARGWVDELGQTKAAQLYAHFGGVSPGAAAGGASRVVEADIAEIGHKGYLANRLTSFHGLTELMQVSESATRNSVFAKVYKQKIKQGLTPYEASIEAAYQGTDILDFGRHGSRTYWLRRTVPFFNAHIQGLDKARRVMLEPLGKLARGEIITTQDKIDLENSAWAVGKMTALGATLGAAYAAVMWEREEYRDANPEVKAANLILPWGHKNLILPKPFELGLGFTAGEYAYAAMVGKDPRAAAQFAEGAFDVMMPPNPLTANPLVKTTFELGLNRSLYTSRDIVPQSLQALDPAHQVTQNTSMFAKGVSTLTEHLANTVNAATGFDAKPFSPVKIDYAIGSMFGMWGKDIQAASNWFAEDNDKPAAQFEDYVFLRRFLKDPNRNGAMTQRYFEFAASRTGEYAQAVGTYDKYMQNFRDADAKAWLNGLTADKKAYVLLSSAGTEEGKGAFSANDRRIHPLVRAQAANGALNSISRELTFNSQINTDGGARIELTPTQRRDAIEAVHQLGALEMRNALVMVGDKGYEGRKILSTQDQFDVLKGIAPQIAEEVQRRYATAKVLPTNQVAEFWPDAKKRLLSDGSSADISDLSAAVDGYEFGGERTRRRAKRRLEISGAAPAEAIQ